MTSPDFASAPVIVFIACRNGYEVRRLRTLIRRLLRSEVSVEVIKNFTDEDVINYFNSFHDNIVTTGSIFATN